MKHFTEDIYNQAKDGNNDIVTQSSIYLTETNCKISKQFEETFKLPLPEWWTQQYPSGEISLQIKRSKKY